MSCRSDSLFIMIKLTGACMSTRQFVLVRPVMLHCRCFVGQTHRSAPTFSSYLSYRPHGRYLVMVLRDPSSLRSVGMTASRFAFALVIALLLSCWADTSVCPYCAGTFTPPSLRFACATSSMNRGGLEFLYFTLKFKIQGDMMCHHITTPTDWHYQSVGCII